MFSLNERAGRLLETLLADSAALRIEESRAECGTRIVDCGMSAIGGLEAGRRLAETSMAGLGTVTIAPGRPDVWDGPHVLVVTDQPVAACLAAQYAGWELRHEKYFAMGSGPMRAAAGREPLFETIGWRESPAQAVGVLETSAPPPDELCREIAAKCRVEPDRLTLICARTRSLAGNVQIVARSVETAMHKLHELGFELQRVVSGVGIAPLPPAAADDLEAIGRTNDSILYGGEVTLYLQGCQDEALREVGQRLPSLASAEFGRPFREVLKAYDFDFYRIDPLLFSPAVVRLVNMDSGQHHAFGQLRPDILARSFGSGKLRDGTAQ